MKTKLLILFSLLILASSSIYAQRKVQKMDSEKQEQEDDAKKNETEPMKDKIKYGGAVSAMFGSGYSYFYLQPWIGYKVGERFMPGAGFTYIYQGVTINSNAGKFTISDNAYGLNIFAKEQLFDNVAAFAEYAPINFTSYNGYSADPPKRVWGNQLFLGGGLFQKNYYFLILYDVLWQAYDVNSNLSNYSTTFKPTPVDFRVGFIF